MKEPDDRAITAEAVMSVDNAIAAEGRGTWCRYVTGIIRKRELRDHE